MSVARWGNAKSDEGLFESAHRGPVVLMRPIVAELAPCMTETHVFDLGSISSIRTLPRILYLSDDHDRTVVNCFCGMQFDYDHLELAPWGTAWPSEACLLMAPIPMSAAMRWHREKEDDAIERAANAADMEAAAATLDKLLRPRDSWIPDDEFPNFWTFEASFNGVYADDKKFPRALDLGLDYLYIELIGATRVHIHACGVRDGCEKHMSRTETFLWNDLDHGMFVARVASHEKAATSISLQELSWCLITTDCARMAVRDVKR